MTLDRACGDEQRLCDLAEELSRFGAPIAPPEQGAEVGEGACSLQPGVAPLELVDRLAEQERSTITAGNNARARFATPIARGVSNARASQEILEPFRDSALLDAQPAPGEAKHGGEFTGTKSFLLRLKKGSYRFVCDPHSGSMRSGFQIS